MRMATFGFVAMDQFMNHAAKITYMFGGQAKFPILYRMTVGAGISGAAEHSVSPYPMYMNAPGLKIILPATPYDVKGLLKTALRDNNPVISFEHVSLGGMKGEVPEEEYFIPFGQACVRREGTDVTVVALAKMVHEALAAAEELAGEGISVEVVDPRTLVPLDKADHPGVGAEDRPPRGRRRSLSDLRRRRRDRRPGDLRSRPPSAR